MRSYLLNFYTRYILNRPHIVIIVLLGLFTYLGIQAKDFRLDASADSLILENDEDYKERKNPYFVNKDGEKVVEKGDEWVKESIVERSPFLDEDDNPIELKQEEPEKPKRRRRKPKTDPENV